MKKLLISLCCAVAVIFSCSCMNKNNSPSEFISKDTTEDIIINAERGDPEAQVVLGHLYYTGLNVKKDYAEAFKWYKKASEQGDANALFYLGTMYYNGEGVQQDNLEGIKLFKKSAEQGNAKSQFMLGTIYLNGAGIEKNTTEGIKWVRKSADQGNDMAQGVLGHIYEYGQFNIKSDLTTSKEWYEKSCKNGNKDGCKEYKRVKELCRDLGM